MTPTNQQEGQIKGTSFGRGFFTMLAEKLIFKFTNLENKFKVYPYTLRPRGWIGTFISIAIGASFAVEHLTLQTIIKMVEVFLVLGPFTASPLYIINDIYDQELDIKHPYKRTRAITSGAIGILESLVLSGILLVMGLTVGYLINKMLIVVILLMVLLQVLYSVPPFRLKDSKVDFIFGGPLNHALRLCAGWSLFRPLTEAPFIFFSGLVTVICIPYIYYKIIHKHLSISKKSLVSVWNEKQIGLLISLLLISGCGLILLSVYVNEIERLALFWPVMIVCSFLLNKLLIPHSSNLGKDRYYIVSWLVFSLPAVLWYIIKFVIV